MNKQTQEFVTLIKSNVTTYYEVSNAYQDSHIDWDVIHNLTKDGETALSYFCQLMAHKYGNITVTSSDKELIDKVVEAVRASDYKDIGVLSSLLLENHVYHVISNRTYFELLQEALDHGESLTLEHIGDCYYHGIGVVKDYTKAFDYYDKSASTFSETPSGLESLMKYDCDLYIFDRIEKRDELEKEIAELRATNEKLKEENEILNLLPDAPAYHEAKRFNTADT